MDYKIHTARTDVGNGILKFVVRSLSVGDESETQGERRQSAADIRNRRLVYAGRAVDFHGIRMVLEIIASRKDEQKLGEQKERYYAQ